MTAPVAVIRHTTYKSHADGYHRWRRLFVFCPGCNYLHSVNLPPMGDERVPPEYPTWEWDGNIEAPTISPSILCHTSVHLCAGKHTYWQCPAEAGTGECDEKAHLVGYVLPDGSCIAPKTYETVPDGAIETLVHNSPHDEPTWGSCHSFVQGGKWVFLGDCAHELAGQTIPLPEIPEWFLSDKGNLV